MAEASISVDLFNPGQVFACMGFLEAAEVLLGDAVGEFDWSGEADVRFRVHARGEKNPFGVVLEFLACSKIRPYVPPGYTDSLPEKGKSVAPADADDEVPPGDEPDASDTFPGPKADKMALPIHLVGGCGRRIDVGHWADASSRNDFKLYSGNRSAATIAQAMLSGTRDKPKKGQREGDSRTLGLCGLWTEQRSKVEHDPFGVATAVGGSFNFDPRGAWTGIDAGYSPNDQKHGLSASPVVEILAAIGLEHARPEEHESGQMRYAVWGCPLPPMLARPLLAGASLAVPKRHYWFKLARPSKWAKVVTFAQEETR
jgi:CRISPR-associated protein Csx14